MAVFNHLASSAHDLFSENKGRLDLCLRLFDTAIKVQKVQMLLVAASANVFIMYVID